jgi:hypothetical protein
MIRGGTGLPWGLSKFLRMVSRLPRWPACITLRGRGACRSGVLATTCSFVPKQTILRNSPTRLGAGHDRNNPPEHILAVSLRPLSVAFPPLQFLIPGRRPGTLAAAHTALVRWNFPYQPDPVARNACRTCGQSLFLTGEGRMEVLYGTV